jgi:hypothetical protein
VRAKTGAMRTEPWQWRWSEAHVVMTLSDGELDVEGKTGSRGGSKAPGLSQGG